MGGIVMTDLLSSTYREQVFSAIRAFTSATIAEANDATVAICKLTERLLPEPERETGYPRTYGDWHPGDEI